jgi:hypothetical protein
MGTNIMSNKEKCEETLREITTYMPIPDKISDSLSETEIMQMYFRQLGYRCHKLKRQLYSHALDIKSVIQFD